MSRQEHKIESWMDLARLIDKLSRQDTTWLFRGEQKCRSIGRDI